MFRVVFVFFCCLFICKRWWIDCLGLGGAGLSAAVCLWLCGFCLGWFPLPLGALGVLRCFVVALPVPSMWLFFKIYDDTVTFCVHCIYKESNN